MSDFMDLLADLSPEQQELFRLRLARLHQAGAPTPAPPIPRQPRTDAPFPLSFGQQRLWFLDQLMPDDLSYVIPLAVRLSGRLNHDALNRSLRALIQRHEILRTTFAQGADLQPVQVIAPPQPESVVVPQIDLRDWPLSERHALAQRRATSEIRQAFNLATGPLLRSTLLRLDDDEHWLILAMHHIISDQWSLGVLIRELGILYQAYAANPPADPVLPELPIQYADYAVWLRDQLHGEVLDQHLGYWRQQLADLPLLELLTDFPRPPVYTSSGATYPVELPLDISTTLHELSQRESATLFMALLAAFNVLLHRWSGQTDIVIGSPIANRNHTATEGLIGFLINTLALRVDLDGNPTFRELLARVRRVCLDAYRHQDLPFEMVVDAVQTRRDRSRNPLFQVSFVLLNAPMEPLQLPEISLSPLELERGATQFDLSLSMIETPAGLRGRLEYNTNLFDRATIARLVGHFGTLLQGIVANPDQPIAALPLLSEAERALFAAWNTTACAFPPQPVSQIFEAQAARTPDAIALQFNEQQVSYAELNARANRLAHYLRSLGVGAETRVGLCVERSLDLVVGMLGILKAGGAYVPLDPEYP
ncbi:MAG TPA: condensation domain-containing protein, partial [Herpetosiphonaceae bacterium]